MGSTILNPIRLKSLNDPLLLRRSYLLNNFGCFLREQLPDIDALLDEVSQLQPAVANEWQRSIAEELLLCHACAKAVPESFYARFADVSPFANSISLEQCRKWRWACGVFPLAEGSVGGIGHVWVTDAEPAVNAEKPKTVSGGQYCWFVATASQWCGSSWQLAGELAAKIVGQAKWVERLALEWIATGKVEHDGRVCWVDGIQPKTQAPQQIITRNWLLPYQNCVDVQKLGQALRMPHLTTSVDDAFAKITGSLTYAQPPQVWDQTYAEYHALIGGSIGYVLAGALTANCSHVVLWHTKASKTQAEDLQYILQQLYPDWKIDLKPVCSEKIVEAEHQFWHYFHDKADCQLLFNITGGNRMMAWAAMGIVRIFPNISTIYRNIDSGDDPKNAFTLLRYAGAQAIESPLALPQHGSVSRVWPLLCRDTRSLNISPQKWLQELQQLL